MIFGFKKVWLWSHWKEKGKNHKLPLSRHFLKFKMSPLVNVSHKLSPLFNRFSTFDKNVNLSKTNPEAEKFFLVFPSLNTSIFYDVSKNSENIKTFSKGLTQKSTPKMEKFSNFFHNGEWNLSPNSHRERNNLITKKLIQTF